MKKIKLSLLEFVKVEKKQLQIYLFPFVTVDWSSSNDFVTLTILLSGAHKSLIGFQIFLRFVLSRNTSMNEIDVHSLQFEQTNQFYTVMIWRKWFWWNGHRNHQNWIWNAPLRINFQQKCAQQRTDQLGIRLIYVSALPFCCRHCWSSSIRHCPFYASTFQ